MAKAVLAQRLDPREEQPILFRSKMEITGVPQPPPRLWSASSESEEEECEEEYEDDREDKDCSQSLVTAPAEAEQPDGDAGGDDDKSYVEMEEVAADNPDHNQGTVTVTDSNVGATNQPANTDSNANANANGGTVAAAPDNGGPPNGNGDSTVNAAPDPSQDGTKKK